MRRHAIVVTGSDYEEPKDILAAHTKAAEIFPWASEICPSQTNGKPAPWIVESERREL